MQSRATTLTVFKEVYDVWRHDKHQSFVWHAQEQLGPHSIQGKRVLELGCGDGILGLYIALSRDPRLCVAVDDWKGSGGSPKRQQRAATLLAQFSRHGFRVVQADFWSLPFPRQSFDVILANNALHHIAGFCHSDRPEDQADKLTHMFKLLKGFLSEEGILVIQEFDGSTIWRFWPFRLRYRQLEWWLHPPLQIWLDAVRLGGFTDVSCDYAIPWRARRVCHLLPRTVLGKALTPGFYLSARSIPNCANHMS